MFFDIFLIIFGPIAYIYCKNNKNYESVPVYGKMALKFLGIYLPILKIVTCIIFGAIDYKLNIHKEIKKQKNLINIEKEIQEHKKDLPRKVSKSLFLNDMYINENSEVEFIYVYNINSEHITSDELLKMKKEIKTNLLESTCKNNKITSLDIPIVYKYIFADSKILDTIRIDKETCELTK